MASEAVFIGGRSGVGKTSVAVEVHARLSAMGVSHALIDGDYLDMAYPPPWEHGLAEHNLAAMWGNYRALGYRRLIYLNTASVFPEVIDSLTAAMGDAPALHGVLLTCTQESARERLSRREIGSTLAEHLASSTHMASRLQLAAPSWVHRIPTDDRTVADIAAEVIDLTGWQHDPPAPAFRGRFPFGHGQARTKRTSIPCSVPTSTLYGENSFTVCTALTETAQTGDAPGSPSMTATR